MNNIFLLKIYTFLDECVKKDYELDKEDIEHIMKLDFDYVRKQYTE